VSTIQSRSSDLRASQALQRLALGCPQCDTVKSILKSKSLGFEEIRIDDAVQRAAFYEKCGPFGRSMPQVFLNDQRLGGVAGLQAHWHT